MIRATISKGLDGKTTHECIIHTLYGNYVIHEPILQDLLTSPFMMRLKKINQYGINNYIKKPFPFTRYDHSLGVLVLLRKFGASLEEQIAGLLHDISHTVFSHVGDYLYPNNTKDESYQDSIHAWFLKQTDITEILKNHGFTIDDVLHKNGCFLMLETDLPNICADRLEYNLYGGSIEGMLDQTMVNEILDHIYFDKGLWYFDSLYHAKLLAQVALQLTESHLAAPWNILVYTWAAQTLKHAVYTNLISVHEIHFSTDDIIWERLCSSKDPIIQEYLAKMHQCENFFVISNDQHYDLQISGKFRGVDPWITDQADLKRLSTLDAHFCSEFERIKEKVTNGWYIKYL